MSSVPCRTALRCFDSFGMEETLPSITPMVVIRLSNRQDASRNDEIRTTHSSGVACERIHLYVLVNGLLAINLEIIGKLETGLSAPQSIGRGATFFVAHRPTRQGQSLAGSTQSLRRNSMRLGSSRHFFLILRWPPPGSQAAKAFAFEARSVSA
jgi:hypothetical protein